MANDWEIEGKKKKLEGKIQEFTSEMVGDDSGKLKGKAKQAAGEIQENLGQLGHKIDREAREKQAPVRETDVERETRVERDKF